MVFADIALSGSRSNRDGNLESDSLSHCTHDAENRLVQVETLSSLPASIPRKRLVFTYDYLGRRARKQSYNGNSAGTSWTLAETRYFVYDGWNLIVELKQPATGAPFPITYYAWGLDASGTLQGARGMGMTKA